MTTPVISARTAGLSAAGGLMLVVAAHLVDTPLDFGQDLDQLAALLLAFLLFGFAGRLIRVGWWQGGELASLSSSFSFPYSCLVPCLP